MAVVKFFAAVNMNQLQGYDDADSILMATPTEIRVGVAGDYYDSFTGTGFTYNGKGEPTGGTVTGFTGYSDFGTTKLATVTGIGIPLVQLTLYIVNQDADALRSAVFGGDDKFTGSAAADVILSYDGDDTLDGGLGADTMTGGDGSDLYHVRDAGDKVKESTAGSTSGDVDTVLSYVADHTLAAGVERGKIVVGSAADLKGNALDNRLIAGTGDNRLDGAGGVDTADYSASASAVTVSLAISGAQATGGSGSDMLASIEDLVGSDFKDQLSGNAGANKLDGGAGADTLTGGNGNDLYVVRQPGDVVKETNAAPGSGGIDVVYSLATAFTLPANVENGRILVGTASDLGGNALDNRFFAGSGDNLLSGAGGVDTVDYGGAASAVTVSLAASGVQATGGSGADRLMGIEDLVGSDFKDQLTGDAGANKLDGGAGADTLTGGDGNDIYVVRQSGDVVKESNPAAATGGIDVVYSALSAYTLPAHVENGRVLSTAAADLTGNALDNRFYAGSGNNVLNGAGGVDSADYSAAAGAVTISLATSGAQATGGSGTDTLVSIEALTGSDHADRLTGSAGNDTLSGGAGSDTLNGGTGLDALVGGEGGDVFVLDVLPDALVGADRLRDFVAGSDTLQLENGVFTALAGTGVLAAANFVANADGDAVDANDFIVYDHDAGRLYYDADGSGVGEALLIAVLTTLPALGSGDLFVS